MSVLILCGTEIESNAHIESKLLQHTLVIGASSDFGQFFRLRKNKKKKKEVVFGLEAGYLATTFALKEHYRPV